MPTPLPPERFAAAVCRKGHFIERKLDYDGWHTVGTSPPASILGVMPFCPTCGTDVLLTCKSCGSFLRGLRRNGMQSARIPPDPFCYGCGEPFPWASREQRISQLEQYVDREDIDEAVKLEAREQIAILAKPPSETTEEETREALRRLKNMAPGFLDSAKPVLQQLIAEGVRRTLGWT